jgi:hypothetical protein
MRSTGVMNAREEHEKAIVSTGAKPVEEHESSE